jgi:hypothetical protein
MADTKRPGFVSAMLKYFGHRPGTGSTDFARELKDLTYEDKVEFHRMLTTQAGIDCDPPVKAPPPKPA